MQVQQRKDMLRNACILAAADNQRVMQQALYRTREDTGIADIREPYPGILRGGGPCLLQPPGSLAWA